MALWSPTGWLRGGPGPVARRSRPRCLGMEPLEARTLLAGDIVITEVHYAPRPPGPGSIFADANEFEFLELKNIGAQPRSLAGMSFSAGLTFTFGNVTVPPGGYVVIANNQQAFVERYGGGIPVVGEYLGGLDNAGETITLRDAQNNVLQSFAYRPDWYPAANGVGHSLVIRDEAAAAGNVSFAGAWHPSARIDGSPGAADVGVYPGAIVINEVLAHQDIAIGDWIELHNTSPAAVDLSGWFLSDAPGSPHKFRIANGTTIAAGGYRTFTQLQHFGGGANGFALSELGDEVVLTSPLGPAGEQYGETQVFPASDNGQSIGRHIRGDGTADFAYLASPTFGAANSAARVGPIVFRELMYNPDVGEEFIELYNAGTSLVRFFDPANPANTWKFTKGINYTFPQNVTLGAGQYLLLVDDNPATFRSANNVPPHVQILSYQGFGGLHNDGEELELSRPGVPEVGGFVPYYYVDRVVYDDLPPWPTQADGDGPSLLRVAPLAYGNDVASWTLGVVGGSPGRGDTDLIGPRVVDVRVGGSSWTRPAISLPTGVGEQSLPLPWSNVDRLSITFSEPVAIDATALGVTGVNVANYGVTADVPPGTLATTITWTFGIPIAADRLLLDLEAERTRDAAGNLLDGDWTDDASVFPSGDGVAGGDFRLRFNVLPGDVNQDGVVTVADRTSVMRGLFYRLGDTGYDALCDVDGNGKVSILDTVSVRNRQGSALPAGSPAAAAAVVDEALGNWGREADRSEPTAGDVAVRRMDVRRDMLTSPSDRQSTPAEIGRPSVPAATLRARRRTVVRGELM